MPQEDNTKKPVLSATEGVLQNLINAFPIYEQGKVKVKLINDEIVS